MTHKIIDDCIEAIKQAFENELGYDAQATEAYTTVNTADGYIDLYCGCQWNEATIVHDDDNNTHDCPTLKKAIEDNMPDFVEYVEAWREDNTSDYWDDHGFRDEADYIRWKYGA